MSARSCCPLRMCGDHVIGGSGGCVTFCTTLSSRISAVADLSFLALSGSSAARTPLSRCPLPAQMSVCGHFVAQVLSLGMHARGRGKLLCSEDATPVILEEEEGLGSLSSRGQEAVLMRSAAAVTAFRDMCVRNFETGLSSLCRSSGCPSVAPQMGTFC